MGEKDQSLEEWLAAERARLNRGFEFEREPTTAPSGGSGPDSALAGVGIGAGVLAGAVAPHRNPATYEGVRPEIIINALGQEIADADTRVEVRQAAEATEVTILQSQQGGFHGFVPALTATLVYQADTLTVTLSDLNQDSARGAWSSMGATVLQQSRDVLLRRRGRGPGALLDAAGHVLQGVERVVEDVQDLRLPSRVWKVIDRVGEAAEKSYLNERRINEARRRAREAAIRAWTHCEYCGHGYSEAEAHLTRCPNCGGPRGPKPAFVT
ncbi:MAG: hypothetical protein GX620_05955 [Chloroflexi bacterium]|nr:hypothetical protein [Chloroflexota bacterium]